MNNNEKTSDKLKNFKTINDKMYSVWMDCDDIDPIMIGIATSEEAAIAMIEESNKELNGFNYSYSSYIPNAICINDIIRTFSQDGLKISECEDINNTFVMTTEYIPEETDYEL